MDAIDFMSAGMVPEQFLHPEWDPELGFRISVLWRCNCQFFGFAPNPLRFRKVCPAHPSFSVDIIMVGIADDDYSQSFVTPEAPCFEARLWPRGTFSSTSSIGLNRILKVRDRLALQVNKRYVDPGRRKDMERKIALAEAILQAARKPKRVRTIVTLPKQA